MSRTPTRSCCFGPMEKKHVRPLPRRPAVERIARPLTFQRLKPHLVETSSKGERHGPLEGR